MLFTKRQNEISQDVSIFKEAKGASDVTDLGRGRCSTENAKGKPLGRKKILKSKWCPGSQTKALFQRYRSK